MPESGSYWNSDDDFSGIRASLTQAPPIRRQSGASGRSRTRGLSTPKPKGPAKPLHCPICNKVIRGSVRQRPEGLAGHLLGAHPKALGLRRRVAGKKCPLCGKRFETKVGMVRHITGTHTNPSKGYKRRHT